MCKVLFTVIISISILSFTSCDKSEGTGGEATIKGKITLREYDHEFTNLQLQSPAFAEEVYIQYGNKQGIGDRVFTDLKGNYQFDYLRPGNYTVYIYSEDSVKKDNTKTPSTYQLTIKGTETVTVPEIIKYKTLDIDKGTGTIAGRIWLINYKKNFVGIKDTALAQERDVYLIYGNHTTFDLRTRTNFDGRYEFQNLVNGTYTVYVYTEDKTGATQLIPIKKTGLVISNTVQYITNDDVYIEIQ